MFNSILQLFMTRDIHSGRLHFRVPFTPSTKDDICEDISRRQPTTSTLLAPRYLLFVDVLSVVEVWAIF